MHVENAQRLIERLESIPDEEFNMTARLRMDRQRVALGD